MIQSAYYHYKYLLQVLISQQGLKVWFGGYVLLSLSDFLLRKERWKQMYWNNVKELQVHHSKAEKET